MPVLAHTAVGDDGVIRQRYRTASVVGADIGAHCLHNETFPAERFAGFLVWGLDFAIARGQFSDAGRGNFCNMVGPIFRDKQRG